MTPQIRAFSDRFGATADTVAAGTGFNRWALLVQWAVETTNGTQVFGNNPGNIRCGPGVFCQYASLQDFARACIATWHSTDPPPLDPWRAQAAGKTMREQLLAIGNSPWDAGRYGLKECGYAGCSLIQRWLADFDGIGDTYAKGVVIMAADTINVLVRGTDKSLVHRRFDGTAWGPWQSLGGMLGTPSINVVRRQNGDIHAFIIGNDGVSIFEVVSTDDGVTWSGFQPMNGAGDGLVAIGTSAVATLTPAEAGQLTHVETMLTVGLKGV
jgi:hypothetical protein